MEGWVDRWNVLVGDVNRMVWGWGGVKLDRWWMDWIGLG